MKFFNVKTAFAVCVVAAGFGGMNVYNAANQSEADLLLVENVEALSSGDGNWGGWGGTPPSCPYPDGECKWTDAYGNEQKAEYYPYY